jgi:regulation of enolase protein 1 (concanavalin A-like superfamily)
VLQQGGGPHLRNILLREATSQNFQITTHVQFEPTSNFQGAGLIVYQDDLNTVALIRAFCNTPGQCVGNGIYFDNIQSGNWTGTNFGTDTVAKDEAFLRIDKTGSTLTGYYSEDGSNWVAIGTHDAPLADPKVGLLAGNSNVVGATAYFDYFMLQDMP